MYQPKLNIFTHFGIYNSLYQAAYRQKCCLNAHLHQTAKHHLGGLYHFCNKPKTITHFLLECPYSTTLPTSLVFIGCLLWDPILLPKRIMAYFRTDERLLCSGLF